MRLSVGRALFVVCLHVAILAPAQARAQNWSFDARAVGLGGVGSTSNVAVDMVDEQRPYRAIVLPFGLLQVIPNLPKLDPTKDEFDLVRAIEYSASPIHFIIGRDDTETGSLFITDLRNGRLSRDLNYYRGFSPATSVVSRRSGVAELGLHVQAESERQRVVPGYLRGRRSVLLDADVGRDRPRAGSRVCEPDAGLYTEHQLLHVERHAQSVRAGGDRRVPRGASAEAGGGELDGLYIGANYHYLHGFQYEHFEPEARLDTNANGLLTVNLSQGLPVSILRIRRRRGAASRSTWVLPRLSIGGRWASASTGLRIAWTGQMSSGPTTFSTASSPAASSSISRLPNW